MLHTYAHLVLLIFSWILIGDMEGKQSVDKKELEWTFISIGSLQEKITASSVLTEDQAVTYAISMPFPISSYSKHKEASREFLKWLSNPEMDKANAAVSPGQGDFDRLKAG